MWWHIACDAMKAGKCLSITYGGFARIVEVHAVGTTKDGNPIMRAWQVRGGSASKATSGWKLFRLDKTWRYALTDESVEAPRHGYKRSDEAIAIIRCQV